MDPLKKLLALTTLFRDAKRRVPPSRGLGEQEKENAPRRPRTQLILLGAFASHRNCCVA